MNAMTTIETALEAQKQRLHALTKHLIANSFPRPEFSTMGWSDTEQLLDDAMSTYDGELRQSYIDHMNAFGYDMLVAYNEVKAENDDYGQPMLDWLGEIYKDLIAFDYNENHA